MAEILAGQGDLAAAAQTASEGLRLTPTAAAGLVLGRVALALDESGIQTNRDQAATLIDELTKIVPGSEQLTELRVQFLCRTGQTKSAQDLISQTLTASPPPSESLLLNLANTSRASGLGLENQLLDTDQKLHGLTPDVALTRALADFANNGLTSAAVLFDHMRSSVGDSASLAWEFARAQFLLSAGSPDAKAAWVDLATHHPDDLTVQLQVIQSGSLTSDRADSLAVIDRLRKMLGDDSVYCDMAKARVLVATRSGDADDREITELFRKLIATHPNMVEPRELWAMVLERQGHIDEAINQLQLAEKIEPTSVNIGLSLASLQQSKGDNEAARQQLAMVEKLTTANAAQLDREARLRQSLGDAAGAIGSLKNLSTRTTDQDLLLADLYCQNHQIPEAGDIVTRLMAAPSPEVLQYAIRFFAATGKDSLAQSALEQLRATKIPATDMVLTEAAYDIASNKHDQAVALLADATSKYPHEPRAWQLRVMTLFNSTHPADAIPVIDQGLAAIPGDPSLLALKDSAADVVVAMTVSQIDKIARDYVQSPINQPADLDVIRSVAQATRSTDPEAYLNLSRALSQRYPGIEGVQLWTVQTYLKARRMRDAAAAASRVLQTFATSPDAAALATAVFSGQQSWSDALDAARKWKALSPGGGVPDVAVARALIHLKRPQEAISQLQPYIEQAKANPDAQGQVLLTYAEALVDTSAVSQAADLILPLGPQTPAWRHDCLTFVAQHLGGADAQQWLTKIAGEVDQTSTDELATVAEAWEAISSRSGADRTQCLKNAEGIFQTIEAASSPTSSALTRDGMYRERAQQLDLAVTMYRRALKTDPNNALAKNNLAMLLIARPPDVREALALAKSLVQTSPAEPEFLDTLASVQLQAGDVDSAVNDLRQACTLAPEELRLQIRLARVLIDHQRKAEAGIVLATIDNSGLDLKALPTDQQHDLARLRSDLSTAPATQGSNL
jgi:predicted Zn-dependent protease